MRVTFLAHDGFLIELNTVCLLFDWWKEPIPPLPDKPLLVFISHRHEDHFNPEVFTLAERKADIQFLLGSDFHLLSRNLEKWRLTPETAAKCRRCGKHDVFQPLPAVTVETFPSTDEGVAWMVTTEDKAIFHAGDLNWWHWEGESEDENRQMEKDYKREIGRLEGLPIDAAFVVLDPRQENAFAVGFDWFMRHTDTRQVFPMHQWGDYGITEKLCGMELSAPYRQKIRPIHGPGEKFQI